MKSENIYVGNIMMCIKLKDRYSFRDEDDEVICYKRNAILIKIADDTYLDLDDIKSDLDLLNPNIRKAKSIKTYYTNINEIYVDFKSLTRASCPSDNIKVKNLKKDFRKSIKTILFFIDIFYK